MSDETSTSSIDTKAAEEEQRLAKNRIEMAQKLKAKGAQSMSYKQYMDLQARREKSKKPALPTPIKLIVATPLLLIACFGVFFIPYIIFQIATGKTAQEKPKKSVTTLEDLMKKPDASATKF